MDEHHDDRVLFCRIDSGLRRRREGHRKGLAEGSGQELGERITRQLLEEFGEEAGQEVVERLVRDLGGDTLRRLTEEVGARGVRELVEGLGEHGLKELAEELGEETLIRLARELGFNGLKTARGDAGASKDHAKGTTTKISVFSSQKRFRSDG